MIIKTFAPYKFIVFKVNNRNIELFALMQKLVKYPQDRVKDPGQGGCLMRNFKTVNFRLLIGGAD